MSQQITALTDAQQAAMPRYVDEWTAIGLNTESADRRRAEARVREYDHFEQESRPVLD